jgi:Sulfite exporter TauE/SafE
MSSAIRCPYFQKAFGWSVPIGGLAGLVGLGGGEFRLPVLMYVVGYPARTAVPLNLAVSLITLTFALVVRSRAVSVAALVPYLNEVAGLAAGGVASAFYGARFVSAIKSEHLIKIIAALLASSSRAVSEVSGERRTCVKQVRSDSSRSPRPRSLNAAQLANLKGQMDAIEQESIQKNCGIQFRPAPPAGGAPAAAAPPPANPSLSYSGAKP